LHFDTLKAWRWWCLSAISKTDCSWL